MLFQREHTREVIEMKEVTIAGRQWWVPHDYPETREPVLLAEDDQQSEGISAGDVMDILEEDMMNDALGG